ncbi:glycosyltransferase [Acidobacteria bacterium ACD]|nr:MAG: glycosyltransferase [Acidobacteriota bacterium]MCE7958387.1 glycosyltransferase [Acidobacteria bacterium ACB2]MDL1948681.1 glycosyltransferase [Acidobacteria bacterium ACD]
MPGSGRASPAARSRTCGSATRSPPRPWPGWRRSKGSCLDRRPDGTARIAGKIRLPGRAGRRSRARTLEDVRMTSESPESLRRELERTRAELREANARIAWMESSRFWRLRNAWWRLKERSGRALRPAPAPRESGVAAAPDVFAGGPAPGPFLPPATTASVDVVVCVHDALEDVRRCLASVVRHSRKPYSVVLVDDGSGPETRDFLAGFAREHGAQLVRNDVARGYTLAANQGLRLSRGDFVALLNSDTVVTPRWLDRLVATAESDERIGVVGPLSNCASWQSIPDYTNGAGDWADNPLPDGLDVDAMAALLSADAGPVRPELPFLNGFCLLIRKETLAEVGLFDEEAFGRGFGEENDFCLRARSSGWRLVLADDAYVHHAQSKSYSHERRKVLSAAAGEALASKHGQPVIDEGVRFCRDDRVMTGLRERSRALLERHAIRREGRERFGGRRVLFVLPATGRGGGANVVLSEGRAMAKMGVEVEVANLSENRPGFEAAYTDPGLPVRFLPRERIPELARGFDAVVATANGSVEWLEPLGAEGRPPVLGYYVQDFEPRFYPEGSDGFRTALASYTRVPGMVLVTKTDWNREEVARRTGALCRVVGPSFDVDLFRPFRSAPPAAPFRVAAMARVSCERRQPSRTMDLLGELVERLGPGVDVTVFGADPAHPDHALAVRSFRYRDAGVVDAARLAAILNGVHVFADFSTYQAMGLTALEAMGCGATAVVPRAGGSACFARDGENALVVDTSSPRACLDALLRLAGEPELRERLMERAVRDAPRHHPEGPALRILEALFGDG